MPESNIKFLAEIAAKDIDVLIEKDRSYGSSWKKRGGSGAFMMLARKWDRIENQVLPFVYDIFKAIECDTGAEHDGMLDDIRDLRRYLLLVESEIMFREQPKE